MPKNLSELNERLPKAQYLKKSRYSVNNEKVIEDDKENQDFNGNDRVALKDIGNMKNLVLPRINLRNRIKSAAND